MAQISSVSLQWEWRAVCERPHQQDAPHHWLPRPLATPPSRDTSSWSPTTLINTTWGETQPGTGQTTTTNTSVCCVVCCVIVTIQTNLSSQLHPEWQTRGNRNYHIPTKRRKGYLLIRTFSTWKDKDVNCELWDVTGLVMRCHQNTVHGKFVRPRFRPADSNNLLRMQVIVSFQTMIQLLENQQKKLF